MKFSSVLSSLLVLCLGSVASCAPALIERATTSTSNACGKIVNSGDTIFEAKLVYECMTSVPFNAAVATRWIAYYNDSMQFQSTLAYLKSPPASYQQPAVDFIGGLNQIQAKINSDSYANEYEFEVALQALLYATHDGHVNMISGILSAFSFGASFGIASVSLDGVQVPKVYLTDDLFGSQEPGAKWQPSAISQINGQSTIDYLTAFASANAVGGLEAHTDWNQLMTSPAQDIQGVFGIWGGAATFYPGDTLTLKLENGTTIGPDPWLAVYYSPGDTGPLETGGDFYNFFVLGYYPASYDPDAEDDSSDDTTTTDTSAASPVDTWDNLAYPYKPDVVQEDLGTLGGGFVSGYFLNKSSTAVLSIPSFYEGGDAIDTFSKTIADFISSSKKLGMQKVVIDLQQNYGGDSLLAYDTFKQFFPTIDPYGGSRMRAHSTANSIGNAINGYWDDLDETYEDYYNLYANEWVATNRINAATNKNFTSWAQFYGPHLYNGDNFSSTTRYNLSDFLFDTIALGDEDGFQVYGYGYNPATTTQPWAAKDIIILSDALCGSTCAIFMEMMHHEAGVRTVVAGGRLSTGPMQAPGLTRGARSYGITDDLDTDIAFAQYILQDENLPSNFLPNRSEALDVVISYAELNLRDQVRKGETTPLQFLYEAANCRIFYTPKTWYNYTALWQYAADAIWTNPSLCIMDSTGYATTNGTATVPPSSVLVTHKAVETPAALGAIIMNIFTGSSTDGLQAKVVTNKNAIKKVDYYGKSCAAEDGKANETMCPKGYYCYPKFSSCSNGKNATSPACVSDCTPSASVDKCTHNSYCQAAKKGSQAIKYTTGYCQPAKSYCSKSDLKKGKGSGESGGIVTRHLVGGDNTFLF